jgi:hypothetical protein
VSDSLACDAILEADTNRYYYAIASFSSTAAAERVMDECNGTEFERTANIFDLSYVPDDMGFDQDEVK